MDPFVRRVGLAMKRLGLPARGGAVAAAFSGGPDSTALLGALVDRGRWRIVAVHVNHHLRPEADREERAARSAAESLGATFRVEHVTPASKSEASARRVREAALGRAAAEAGAEWIATGHTRDDQAETVLYRAARGSGVRGLRGILETRALRDGVTIVRPLLDATRGDVLAYVKRRGLTFVTDSSNADTAYARNRIRRDVLPALEQARPGAARRLAELARAAAELAGWMGKEAESALGNCRTQEGLSFAGLAALPATLRHAVLELAEPTIAPLLASHRKSLDRLFTGGRTRLAELRDGWQARVQRETLVLRRKPFAEKT